MYYHVLIDMFICGNKELTQVYRRPKLFYTFFSLLRRILYKVKWNSLENEAPVAFPDVFFKLHFD